MRKEKKQTYMGLALRIVLPLLLVMACILLPPTMAKYISSATGTTPALDIARFDVEIGTMETANLSMDHSVGQTSASCTFTVSCDSEVSVYYDVIITLPEHNVYGLIMQVGAVSVGSEAGKTEYVLEAIDLVPYGDTAPRTYTLIFDSTDISDNVTLTGIQISVRARQAD